MTETERLKAIFDYLRENKIVRNQQDFVERIGSDKSTVSQILNGHISIPSILFGKIVAAFPQFNEDWLRSEKGSMLKPSVHQTSFGDHSPNVNGDRNHVGRCASLDRSFDEIAEQRKLLERAFALLEKRDAQLDRMIALLELQLQK